MTEEYICEHKSRYADAEAAHNARGRSEKRHPEYLFAAYRCPADDSHWHVGRLGTRAEAERQAVVAREAEVADGIVRLKRERGW